LPCSPFQAGTGGEIRQAEEGHRILQQIRQHQSNARAFRQPQNILQICSKAPTFAFEIGEGKRSTRLDNAGKFE